MLKQILALLFLQSSLYSADPVLLIPKEERSRFERAVDGTKAFFLRAVVMAKKMVRLSRGELFPEPIEEEGKLFYTLPWMEKESEGLYLFVHGIFGHPVCWDLYWDRVDPKSTIFAPIVYQKGNVPLKVAASPILGAVRDYLHQHPGKPIYLFGTSNGCRITTYIENHLTVEELGTSPLRVVSIAGVFGGSRFLKTLEKYYIVQALGLHPELRTEFSWKNEVAKNLMNDWTEKQRLWKEHGKDVQHFFVATREDELIRPLQSCFPHTPEANCFYKLYRAESHMSVVDRAVDDIFRWCQNVNQHHP